MSTKPQRQQSIHADDVRKTIGSFDTIKKLFSGNTPTPRPTPTPTCVEEGGHGSLVGHFCRGSWRKGRLVGARIEAYGIRIDAQPSSCGDSDLVGPLCRALVDAGLPDGRLDLYDDRGMHCLIVRSIHQRAGWDLVERGGCIRWIAHETRLIESESILRCCETGSESGGGEAMAASVARGSPHAEVVASPQEGTVISGNSRRPGQLHREAA